jgi:hypothetical protein
MRFPRLLVPGFTAVALAAGFAVPTATAHHLSGGSQEPMTVARAMFANPGLVTDAELAPDGDTDPQTDPRAVLSSSQGMAGFPTHGADFGMLSTGDAAVAHQPNNSPSTSTELDGLDTNVGADLAGLVITFTAPPGANCMRIDVKLLSEEFPHYVGSEFNDFAAGNINNPAGPTVSGSDPSLPGNFLYDGSEPPNELEINTSHLIGAEAASGTTYNGATPILVAQTEVTPGAPNVLRLWAGDVGDSVLDTTVFIDNVRVFADSPCPTQTKGPSIVKKIKTKVSRGRATIVGKILPVSPGGKVSLTFFANGSPLKKRATKKATLNSKSKYRKRFKVPSEATRCKVKVSFQGDAAHFPSAGKKKFKC